jgi:hypothetical protein
VCVCRCAAYGNLSLQHWPVETKCSPCETGQGGSLCCFAEHLTRDCDASKYPGGAPGHCTEVPALELKERKGFWPGAVPAAAVQGSEAIGYVEFCKAEDENATRRSMKLSDERSGGAQPSAAERGDSDEVAHPTVELTQDEAQRVKAIESEHEKLRAQVRERSWRQSSDRHRQWVYSGLRPPTLLSAASSAAEGDKSPGEAQGPALHPAHHPAPVR